MLCYNNPFHYCTISGGTIQYTCTKSCYAVHENNVFLVPVYNLSAHNSAKASEHIMQCTNYYTIYA